MGPQTPADVSASIQASRQSQASHTIPGKQQSQQSVCRIAEDRGWRRSCANHARRSRGLLWSRAEGPWRARQPCRLRCTASSRRKRKPRKQIREAAVEQRNTRQAKEERATAATFRPKGRVLDRTIRTEDDHLRER